MRYVFRKAISATLLMFLMLAVIGVLGYFVGDFARYQVKLVFRPSDECREKVYVYVSLMYPEGLKQISKAAIDLSKGKGELLIDLRDLKKAWDEEYRKTGTYAEPLIVISGHTRSGRVFVKGINLFWNNLTRTVSTTLKPLKGVNVKKGIVSSTVKCAGCESKLEPLDGCWEYRDLVDSYEQTRYVLLVKIKPDSETHGFVDFTYFINKVVGFRVNVFIESQWTSAGFNPISKNEIGNHLGDFGRGEEYYIWMKVKYRYEKWHVWGRCDGERIDYYEEYIYIKDFYPSTIDGGTSPKPGSRMPPIDSWKYEGKYTSTRDDKTYYKKTEASWGSDKLAIDALKFISVLKALGKISSKAANAATAIGLFINVDFVYESKIAFDFDIGFYSDAGLSHKVYYGRSHDFQWAPVIYFKTYLTS